MSRENADFSHRAVYGADSVSLLRDGKPWLPVMGEIHYARCPRACWRETLLKMRATGVDIVSTYVFWLHHEREEGRVDFSGGLELSAFLRECALLNLPVWLRIGPWCHGEARNGGFPDWLLQKGIPLRCDDPEYMALTRAWWTKLFAQAQAALYKNGGPIIGIQIENEFGHCGGSGEDRHMDALYALAREIGFDAPYWTATGWGGARIGTRLIPVMACYCDAPWDRRLHALPPSPNYLFSHERNDADVGSDFAIGAHVTFDEAHYPYLLAEMGGGIGSTFHRRLTASAADTAAMSLVKLGSGANLIGYYMYCGGANPGADLNETRESGSYCETPALSYSPHAPIGEYGQVGEMAKAIKCLSMFLRDYGEALSPMPAEIFPDNARDPADDSAPRYSVRMAGDSGFLFINNHQRGLSLSPKRVRAPYLNDVDVPAGWYGVLPIRLPIGKAFVSSKNASPLCVLNGKTFVFWSDGEAKYEIEGDLDGREIVTLTRREALNAWRIKHAGAERLIIADGTILQTEDGVYMETRHNAAWRALPAGSDAPGGFVTVPNDQSSVACIRTQTNYQCYEYELLIQYAPGIHEAYLRVAYEGSIAELYVNGLKIADDMYDGGVWEVGLNRLGKPEKATLRLYALFEGMPVYLQNPPPYTDGRALALNALSVENDYHRRLEGLYGYDQ